MLSWEPGRDAPTTPVTVRLQGEPSEPGLAMLFHPLPGSTFSISNLLGDTWPARVEDPESRPPTDALRTFYTERKRRWDEEARKQEAMVVDEPRLLRRVRIPPICPVPVNVVNVPGPTAVASLDVGLLQVHLATGLPIVADYDPCFSNYYYRAERRHSRGPTPLTASFGAGEVPAIEVLQRLSRKLNLTWRLEKGWIVVTSPRVAYAVVDKLDLFPGPWKGPDPQTIFPHPDDPAIQHRLERPGPEPD